MEDFIKIRSEWSSNFNIKFAKNLNASDAMLDALKLNFEEIQQSKEIKAVIIKGLTRFL